MTKNRTAVLTCLGMMLALTGCTGAASVASPGSTPTDGASTSSASSVVGPPPVQSSASTVTQTQAQAQTQSRTPAQAGARTRQPTCSPELEGLALADPTRGGTIFTDPPDGGVLCRYGRPATADQTRKLVAQHTLTAAEAKRIAALTDQGQRLTTLPAGCPYSRADLVVGLFVLPTDAVVPVEYSLDGCFGLAMNADASRLVSRPLRALLADLTG